MAFSIVPVTAADASFSAAGASAWAAGFRFSGDMTWQAGGAAGEGLAIAAGTAASAVSALSLTQTWNYAAAAIQGVDWAFTDTSSHANTNAFRIRGGSAGTTDLISVTKAGSILLGSASSNYIDFTNGDGSYRIGKFGNSLFFNGGSSANIFGLYSNIFAFPNNKGVNWSADATYYGTVDTNLERISAGVLGIGTGAAGSFAGSLKLTNIQNVGYDQFDEMTAPAGTANSVRLFCQDNGAGKSQLMCIFGSGAAQQIAIEV